MALVLSGIPADIDIPPEMPTTGPDLELQLQIWVETLWPFLCNPGDSPICAASVHIITRRFLLQPLQDQTKAAARILRTKHQQVLDGILHFVAIPRPLEVHDAVEAKLNHCECDLTVPVLDMIHTDADESWNYAHMIMSLFTVLELILETLKIGHVGGSQSVQGLAKDPETAKWPVNTAAFFPAGPDKAIMSFTRLYKSTKMPAILDFIRVALPHCPSLASPAVNSAAFWEALLEELEWAADRLDTDPAIAGNSTYIFEGRPPPGFSIRQIVMLIQALIFTFTDSLRQDIQTSCLMSYARSIYDVLLKVLIDFNRRPPTSTLNDLRFFVTGVAMTIITALPKNHPRRPQRLPAVLLSWAELHKGGDFSSVYSVISRLSESVAQCCNAACAVTSESSAQKLQYCAQCQVMRYCSGVCHKAAWKYHKLVCKDLGKLKKETLPRASRSNTGGGSLPFLKHFGKEALKDFSVKRMRELQAELVPFLHFENVGMSLAPSHEKAKHY
ncbi:hypothetical protein K438DRAFT_1851137 [Mycena galopus ATCC 62051]|nr:hypothetical protein K438DRAFT_1851137 [Mycena galopus ATCC 62051]